MLRKNSTLAEILLWNELKGGQMLGYDFHRQKPIDEYVVDFFCPRLLLTIEIDGESYEDKAREDKERQKQIEIHGVRFLRFSDDDVKKDLDTTLETIRQWIEDNRKQKE